MSLYIHVHYGTLLLVINCYLLLLLMLSILDNSSLYLICNLLYKVLIIQQYYSILYGDAKLKTLNNVVA